jgi:hypothetical protein
MDFTKVSDAKLNSIFKVRNESSSLAKLILKSLLCELNGEEGTS